MLLFSSRHNIHTGFNLQSCISCTQYDICVSCIHILPCLPVSSTTQVIIYPTLLLCILNSFTCKSLSACIQDVPCVFSIQIPVGPSAYIQDVSCNHIPVGPSACIQDNSCLSCIHISDRPRLPVSRTTPVYPVSIYLLAPVCLYPEPLLCIL